MLVIDNERVIFFDVDETLIRTPNYGETSLHMVSFVDPYSGNSVKRLPHKPHIRLLKNNKKRGAFVIVWSKNGYQWAKAAVDALGLHDHVDLIITKPFAFADDQTPDKWMGEHVYIPHDDSFGQEG